MHPCTNCFSYFQSYHWQQYIYITGYEITAGMLIKSSKLFTRHFSCMPFLTLCLLACRRPCVLPRSYRSYYWPDLGTKPSEVVPLLSVWQIVVNKHKTFQPRMHCLWPVKSMITAFIQPENALQKIIRGYDLYDSILCCRFCGIWKVWGGWAMHLLCI